MTDILSYLPEFRQHLQVILGRRKGTVLNYCRVLELFQVYLEKSGGAGGKGSLNVEDVAMPDIERWLKDLFYQRGNVNQTRASQLSAIKAFWRFLAHKGVISESSPILQIPSPKICRPLPRKFTTDQLRRIFSRPDLSTPAGIRDMAILKVLYGTGPRVDEIRMLDLDDLHPDGKNVFIHFRDTKGGKERRVHLGPNPTDALMKWLAIREKYIAKDPDAGRSVFVSLDRYRPGHRMCQGSYNKILKKYAVAVGVKTEDAFVHKLRATFATDLYDMGYGIKEISILMGHESVASTERYIAISETALKRTYIPGKRWKELERKEVPLER